ncbi:ABC transporter permease [Chloroflexota bacterium]
MAGQATVFRKELADQLSSRRFVILLALVCIAGLSAIYVAAQSIRADLAETTSQSFVFLRLLTTSSDVLPPFVSFVAFFGPLVGLALGFDAINREQSSGTLGLVLSQPVFRDAVINGKFLAGVTTIAFMLVSIVLIVTGLGLKMLGIPPSFEEVMRIVAYLGVSIVYISFWMALAMLFSILFRRITTSALAGIAVWMFFVFFMSMIAGIMADRVAPVDEESDIEAILRHERVAQMVMRVSPSTLYSEATVTILVPTWRNVSGPVLIRAMVGGMIPGPLPLSQSLMLVWPHLIGMIALMLVCFAASYTVFMRQEIRPP